MNVAVFDPLRVLRLLIQGNVDFIVIGGLAARVWGSPTVTNDIDVCYATTRANIESLATVLEALHARPRGFDPSLPFILDAKTIAMGNNFTFETDAGNVDCLGTPSGTEGFNDLRRSAELIDLGDGLEVWFASLDDVIRMKTAAQRPKDLIELEILKVLKEERAPHRESADPR